jgi:neurofibromin 1
MVYDLLGLACLALFRVDIGFIVPSGPMQQALFDPQQSDWVREVADIYQRKHPDRLRLASVRAYELFQTPSSLVTHGRDYGQFISTWVAISNPSVLRYFAKCALEAGGNPFEELLFSRLIKDNLRWWATRENNEISKQKKYSGDRAPSLALAEIALLSLLTSTQSAVCQNACAGLQLLASAEHHPEAPRTTHFTDDVQAKRLLVYEQIWEPGYTHFGTPAFYCKNWC